MSKRWRLHLIGLMFVLAALVVAARLVYLSTAGRAFLLHQSQQRILRTVTVPTYRGMLLDRTGQPVAVSVPAGSIWVNPKLFKATAAQLAQLGALLKMSVNSLEKKINNLHRSFVYLKRDVPNELAKQIKQLKLTGLYIQRESRRVYPLGRVMSHVLGMTNVDGRGQEGLELALNKWLTGVSGKKEVIRDRFGHVVKTIAWLQHPHPGRSVQLTVDHRIQYLAMTALSQAIKRVHATSGSVVVLDVQRGDVLAMVNQPDYDPNDYAHTPVSHFRNRAVTDVFEPGSTMKPFTAAQALMSKRYDLSSVIDTRPGRMKVGGYWIRDDLNYGKVTLKRMLQKSSNIAAAKIMLSLGPRGFWRMLSAFGFGERTHSGFPGEVRGQLRPREIWFPSEVATLAYGYGLSVTAIQLAHAYAILAAGGVSYPVNFLLTDAAPVGQRVIPARVANQVLHLLESVVHHGGTGHRAIIPGYRVAGKTGTAYIATRGGYDKTRYISSFVGVAPVSRPRFVVAVVIRDARRQHFGSQSAAPVFQAVMTGALHRFGIAPDATQ